MLGRDLPVPLLGLKTARCFMESEDESTAVLGQTVSDDHTITIGKGKERAGYLPVSSFTFQMPAPSTSTECSISPPAHSDTSSSSPQSTLQSTPADEQPDPNAPGSLTPRLKQRRVSTSSLPTLANPQANWAFRDEMGISSPRASTSTSAPLLATTKSNDHSQFTTVRKAKPRKSASTSTDAVLSTSYTETALDPAPKRARRNMWTDEETLHLVEGCELVRAS